MLVKLIASILCGSILAFSQPGFDLWFLAWLFLSPLFILINTSSRLKDIVLYSGLFGFFFNLISLHWLFSLHPLTWLGLNNQESFIVSALALLIPVLYNALYYVLFGISIFLIKTYAPEPYGKGIFKYLLVALAWIIIFNKISSSKLLFGFPWTLIEYSQYKVLPLIQVVEYFGGLFIAFLLVFFNQVIADIYIAIFNREKIGGRYLPKNPGAVEEPYFGLMLILFLIGITFFYGLFTIQQHKQKFTLNSQTVLVLQGNLPISATRGQHLDINLAKKVYSKLLQGNKADLIVAPEGALPVDITSDADTKYWMKSSGLKQSADIIFGSYCTDKKGDYTNCAASYTKGEFLFYDKQRLVPFGEFVPFYPLLPSPLKTFANFALGEGFVKGQNKKPLRTAFGKVGVNICFELIFPEQIRELTLQGANMLLNLSDLSWFHSALIKKQFLAFAIFRAVENRKPFVIVTNSGLSVFVESSGEIRRTSKLDTEMVILDWITPNNIKTFYAKYGW